MPESRITGAMTRPRDPVAAVIIAGRPPRKAIETATSSRTTRTVRRAGIDSWRLYLRGDGFGDECPDSATFASQGREAR